MNSQERDAHRHLRPYFALCKPEDVLDSEQLSLAALIALHAFEISRLQARLVANGHLLLLVDLACVDQLLHRTSPE